MCVYIYIYIYIYIYMGRLGVRNSLQRANSTPLARLAGLSGIAAMLRPFV